MRNGKKKNKITPAVMLLSIDQVANIATPTTVVIDEMVRKIAFLSTPQMIIHPNSARILSKICKYLITKLALFSIIWLELAYRRTNLATIIRQQSTVSITIALAIHSLGCVVSMIV